MDAKDEIIQEIARVAREISPEPLTRKAFARASRISQGRVRYYFGSWNKGVEAAGLSPRLPPARTTLADEDLLAAIGALWKSSGRRPTGDSMNAEGAYTIRPYCARWGTFTKAVDEYVRRFGQ